MTTAHAHDRVFEPHAKKKYVRRRSYGGVGIAPENVSGATRLDKPEAPILRGDVAF
jgi:hypothetical protein